MIRSRILKDGQYHFYEGKRKATEKQVREFIKKDYDVIRPEKLGAELRKYLGAVKGGKNRAAQALITKEGHFLPKYIQDRAIKNLGIDIDQIRKDKDYKTIKEVFANDHALRNSFDKLISVTGLEMWYSEKKSMDKIDSYTGKNFILNGEKVTKDQMYKKVGQYARKLHRVFDVFDLALRFKYTGIDTLSIDLDPEIFEEGSEGEDTDNVQLYFSGKKK